MVTPRRLLSVACLGLSLVLAGSASAAPGPGPAGVAGSALRFTGGASLIDGGGRVDVPDSPLLAVTAVTLETWFMWDGTYDGTNFTSWPFLMGKAVSDLEIHLDVRPAYRTIRFIPTLGVYLDTPTGVINPNVWYHVACVYDPAQGLAKIYLNGVDTNAVNNGASPLTTALSVSASPFRMGMRGDGWNGLSGALDEVRVWNCARSQAEIAGAMAVSFTGSMPPGLVGSWRMNEGIGTTVSDNSGHGLTGTFGGSQWPFWIVSGAGITVTVPLLDTVGVVALALMLAGGAVVILRRRQQLLPARHVA